MHETVNDDQPNQRGKQQGSQSNSVVTYQKQLQYREVLDRVEGVLIKSLT